MAGKSPGDHVNQRKNKSPQMKDDQGNRKGGVEGQSAIRQ